MKKIICLVMLLLLACVIVTACGEAVFIRSANAEYEVTSVRAYKELDDQPAPNEGKYLLIKVQGAGKDMDDMQVTFFDMESSKPTVTDGAATAECEYVTFGSSGESNNAEVTATLLFEIPAEFGKQFTLSGEAFGSVELSL